MEKPSDAAPLKGGNPNVHFAGSLMALPDQPSQLKGLRLMTTIGGEIRGPCTLVFEISFLTPAQETGAKAASGLHLTLLPPQSPCSPYSHRFYLTLHLSGRPADVFLTPHKCLITPSPFSRQALIIRSQERHFILHKSKY